MSNRGIEKVKLELQEGKLEAAVSINCPSGSGSNDQDFDILGAVQLKGLQVRLQMVMVLLVMREELVTTVTKRVI